MSDKKIKAAEAAKRRLESLKQAGGRILHVELSKAASERLEAYKERKGAKKDRDAVEALLLEGEHWMSLEDIKNLAQ